MANASPGSRRGPPPRPRIVRRARGGRPLQNLCRRGNRKFDSAEAIDRAEECFIIGPRVIVCPLTSFGA
eukprot:12345432-Alexandrium_andersonii.AAC.1